MASSYDKLIEKLKEIFQLDQADLDFGIYRIMNQKRDEITSFLENDLLPQVKEAFAAYQSANASEVRAELDKLTHSIEEAGMNPDDSPKVKEVRQKLGESVDITKLEDEVYSDLYSFFRRYYDEGDFISLRRYKEGVYAIPYEGEEVKLHWANADQYYVKTTESFRDYTFKLPSGKRVHFKIVDASTEKDNNKPINGNGRRFVVSAEQPISEENGELIIPFEYQPADKKVKQADLDREAVKAILAAAGFTEWIVELGQKSPTEKSPNRTVLEKQLTEYTAKNTFDYFIHKDLGKFLRRELDFYIKNEVMHLDDVDTETPLTQEQYFVRISKVKSIRRIAHKIIDFLSQIEGFQKRLWLKKKFVVETNYCITLDRVPEELYPEIAANEAQREEWVRLFAIDEMKKDVLSPGYSVPLSTDFLSTHGRLVVDTRHFSHQLRERILSSIPRLDDQLDGLLIHSENQQALGLLASRYKNGVDCVYIDPPYNTGSDEGFIYKDSYQESSWLAMMHNRLSYLSCLAADNATVAVSIDLKEVGHLETLLCQTYGKGNRRALITVKRGSVTGPKVINPGVVNVSEYVAVYSTATKEWQPSPVFRAKDRDPRYNSYILNRDSPHDKWRFVSLLERFAEELGIEKGKVRKTLGDEFQPMLIQFMLDNAQSVCRLANLDDTKISQQAQTIRAESLASPDSIFFLPRDGVPDWYIINGQRILFHSDRLVDIHGELTAGELVTDIWDDVLPNDLHNEGRVSLKKGKKPEKLLQRVLQLFSKPGDTVLDYFVGSGTSCAVSHKMGRRWIGVDSSNSFDQLPLTRMKIVLWGDASGITKAEKWKGGGAFKYVRLESYEDALNNLALDRTKQQQELLDMNPDVKEDYMLRYMLDVESRGSASLLNIDAFEDPFNYKLNIATGDAGETRPTVVDLVETFNYLLGLTVKHIDFIRGFRVVEGTSPTGEHVLVIWRNLKEKSNDDLDEFFQKQGYNTQDMEFDLIYVNGDNNLENLRLPDQTWKVRLIEEHFQKLMFDVEDV